MSGMTTSVTVDRERFEAYLKAALTGGATVAQALERTAVALIATAPGAEVNPAKTYGPVEFAGASPTLKFSDKDVTISLSITFGTGFITEFGK